MAMRRYISKKKKKNRRSQVVNGKKTILVK